MDALLPTARLAHVRADAFANTFPDEIVMPLPMNAVLATMSDAGAYTVPVVVVNPAVHVSDEAIRVPTVMLSPDSPCMLFMGTDVDMP